ncbi:gypsy/ty3 retroelement polyprotein [Tanacetum coccineum]
MPIEVKEIVDFGRLGKMEFPKFHKEDVKGWMFRVKQFFVVDAIGDVDKIKLVSIHLYDRALTWHLQFVKTHGKAVTWAEYEEAVLKRFGDANEDPMTELKNLRYKTTMKQYQSNFEALLNQVNITETQAISMYIARLHATIEMNGRMFRLRSFEDAFSLSSLQETTLALVKAPVSQTVTKNNSVFGHRPRKMLSQKKYDEKRAKNQCFYFDQKYMPGHKCEGKIFTVEIRGEEEEVFEDCLGEESNELTEYVLPEEVP